jgi:hypothetical protein
MNKAVYYVIILLILAVLPNSSTYAEIGTWWVEEGDPPYDETTDSPLLKSYPGGLVIDWQKKVAITTGRVALTGPMTIQNREKIKRIAENQALDKLINCIGLIRIDGFTKLSDIIDRNFALRGDIINLIRKTYRIIHEEVYKDEDILKVTIKFDLAGKAGLSGTLFPVYLKELPSPTPSAVSSSETTSEVYSGLIIDASDLGIEGGLSPNIISPDGQMVYFLIRNPDKGALITSGFVDYVPATGYSSEDVSRAGEAPLRISAKTKLKSPYNCDIVISREDAEKVIKADTASNFLRKLKVVILL